MPPLMCVTPYKIKASQAIVAGAFLAGDRLSAVSMIPQLTANSSQGFVTSSSSLWPNAPYWQTYYPFKQDDSGNLVGVGDQANAGFVATDALPQWIQVALPEKTYVEKIGICWIRNDGTCAPAKDMKVILDGTTTITASLSVGASIGQNVVHYLTINRAATSIKIQTDTNRSTGYMYLHDIIVTGVALDIRANNGTLQNSLHDITVSGSQQALGTRWRAKGKRYFELKVTQCGGSSSDRSPMLGIGTTAAARTGNGVSNSSFYSIEAGRDNANLTTCRNGNAGITAPAYTKAVPYYCGILVDFDAGTMGIITPNGDRVDNVYTGIAGNNWFPVIAANGALSNNTERGTLNFGASAFNFALPSGYTAWCEADTPVVAFNPADISANAALSNSNRTFTISGTGVNRFGHTATFKGGKLYAEFTVVQNTAGGLYIGVDKSSVSSTLPNVSGIWSFRSNGGLVNDGAYSASGGLSFTTGDRIMLAIDTGSGKLWIGKNGVWLGTGNPKAGTGQNLTFTTGFDYRICIRTETQATADSVTIESSLQYPPPYGFDQF